LLSRFRTRRCAACVSAGRSRKVYAAYKAAVDHKGSPTVILARTIKATVLGGSGRRQELTHQQKKLNEDELREFARASAFH